MPVAARLRNLVTDPTQSGYRESDPGLHHGTVMRYHYATSARSLPEELNSHYLRTEEACCRYH